MRQRIVIEPPELDRSEVEGWFAGRLPDDWFTGPPEISYDRDEILVTGTLPEPQAPTDEGADPAWRKGAEPARISRFREDTRSERMGIAESAQDKFGRTVSWAARCGETEAAFTVVGSPVMTRLRLHERQLLDTLIETNIARSRSEALGWCVRLVARNQSEWITELRDALTHVERARQQGPAA